MRSRKAQARLHMANSERKFPGDFTPEEYALISQSGAVPITLGELVLRVETAAIYCLSILNYELAGAAAFR